MPSTLWSGYLMLKATLFINKIVDTRHFTLLIPFLKKVFRIPSQEFKMFTPLKLEVLILFLSSVYQSKHRFNNGKYQPVRINSFSKIPNDSTKYLNLENQMQYTWHSLRGSSTILLVELGTDILTVIPPKVIIWDETPRDILTLKCRGGRETSTIATLTLTLF